MSTEVLDKLTSIESLLSMIVGTTKLVVCVGAVLLFTYIIVKFIQNLF